MTKKTNKQYKEELKKQMKKLLKPLLTVLVAVMVCSMMPSAFAAGDEAIDAAYALNELGLFNGVGKNANGTPNFDLDRAPTRHESVVMLVRLLGKEAEAKAGTWETPFTDVAEWAEPYVGYAYVNGLVSGTSATKFSGTDVISASQYLTLVLRALGYKSGTDFQWDKAWELSDQIGLTDKRYNADSTQFTRGDIAIISRNALRTKEKEVEGTLLDALVASAAVDNETAEVYKSSVRVKSITLNESDLLMNRGGSVQLIASVLPEDATDKSATWFSSDPKIVEVSSDGLLEAKQFGTVKITATASNGLSAVCNVTVKPIEVASVTLNYTDIGLVIGETYTLNATITPSNADNKNVSWSSSNTSVVTVAGGNITGIKEGSAIITATAGNQKAVCTVSVTQNPFDFSDTFVCYRKADYLPDFGAMFGIKPVTINEDDFTIGFAYLASDLQKATGDVSKAYGEYLDTLTADHDFEAVTADSSPGTTAIYLRNKKNGKVCGITSVIIRDVMFINIVATKS